MQVLHKSTVLPEEIDSLGHMNVRYYMQRMELANQALIQNLALPEQTLTHGMLRRVDTYTRFRREQFEGAALHAVGGILSLGEGGMRSYVEIRNPDKDEVAATFIVTTALTDRQTRTALPFPVPAANSAEQIEVPDYARPRTLELGPVNTDVSVELLEQLIPEIEGNGMMSGKRNAEIEAEDVGADGWLRDDVELMFLPFAKMARDSGTTQGPPVYVTEQGKRVGWAVMESRTLVYGQPRLGDQVVYFSGDLNVAEKSRHSRRWAFDQTTGNLLGISDNVGLCIDLDARRAVAWPEALRQEIEKHQLPQLA